MLNSNELAAVLAQLNTNRLDPVLLAERAGYQLDDWQMCVAHSTHPRILLNIHRQGGKSLICALIALHTALYQPNSPVLLVSPSLRQSTLLFRTALALYRTLGKPVAPEIENRLSLELENGSQIVSLPGAESTIRGFSGVKLVIIDEGARVLSALLAAIRPFLATTGGRIIAPSTPAGRRGWWYEAWEHGGDTWERYMVKADVCPRISKEFLEEERRVLGPAMYAREYECSFDESEQAIFPEFLLQRIVTQEVSSWSDSIPPPAWEVPPLS